MCELILYLIEFAKKRIVFGCIWIDFYGLELNFVERFSPNKIIFSFFMSD